MDKDKNKNGLLYKEGVENLSGWRAKAVASLMLLNYSKKLGQTKLLELVGNFEDIEKELLPLGRVLLIKNGLDKRLSFYWYYDKKLHNPKGPATGYYWLVNKEKEFYTVMTPGFYLHGKRFTHVKTSSIDEIKPFDNEIILSIDNIEEKFYEIKFLNSKEIFSFFIYVSGY